MFRGRILRRLTGLHLRGRRRRQVDRRSSAVQLRIRTDGYFDLISGWPRPRARASGEFRARRVTFGGAPRRIYIAPRATRDEICKTDYLGDSQRRRSGRTRGQYRRRRRRRRSERALHAHHGAVRLFIKASFIYSADGGRSLMGKRSVIKLLITNSRGKNSQEFTRASFAAAASVFSLSLYFSPDVRAGVSKIFTVAENCRALREPPLRPPRPNWISREREQSHHRPRNRENVRLHDHL